jgi:hypothetical protein
MPKPLELEVTEQQRKARVNLFVSIAFIGSPFTTSRRNDYAGPFPLPLVTSIPRVCCTPTRQVDRRPPLGAAS